MRVVPAHNQPTTLLTNQDVLEEVTSMVAAGDAALRGDYRAAQRALHRPGVLNEADLQALFDNPVAFVDTLPVQAQAAMRQLPGCKG